MINNAGIEAEGVPVWSSDMDYFERVLAVNFWGVVNGTKAFLPQLLDGDFGALVNVSSLFGLVGAPNQADYCASKFAVKGFTEALATELLHSHVGVHCVHPGGIATNISRRAEGRAFHRKYLRTDPAEVARVVLDAVGTNRPRIVCGHRARSTWLGAKFLPPQLMSRLIRSDLAPTLDDSHYLPSKTRSDDDQS